MAFPPFNPNVSVPQDNDIVSQYPSAARTWRDIIVSWFLVDGNNMGRKNKVSFDWQDTEPTGVDEVSIVWADEDGVLRFKQGFGDPVEVGVPLGGVIDYSLPILPTDGWIWADGSQVTASYPTYRAALIAAGNPYGESGGNPLRPDYRGRVGIGRDDMGGTAANRMTSGGSGIVGTLLGATGGSQVHQLAIAELPSHNHTGVTDSAGEHQHFHQRSGPIGTFGAGPNGPANGGNIDALTGFAGAHGHNLLINFTGSDQAHNNTQPGIVCNKIIRAY